jgi:hypothetical protein
MQNRKNDRRSGILSQTEKGGKTAEGWAVQPLPLFFVRRKGYISIGNPGGLL